MHVGIKQLHSRANAWVEVGECWRRTILNTLSFTMKETEAQRGSVTSPRWQEVSRKASIPVQQNHPAICAPLSCHLLGAVGPSVSQPLNSFIVLEESKIWHIWRWAIVQSMKCSRVWGPEFDPQNPQKNLGVLSIVRSIWRRWTRVACGVSSLASLAYSVNSRPMRDAATKSKVGLERWHGG